jgi:hypothetical protein
MQDHLDPLDDLDGHKRFPIRVKRQIGPQVWVFQSMYRGDEGGVGCTWLVVAEHQGHHSDSTVPNSTIVTHIAGDAVDAYDPSVGAGSSHPLPYPDIPYSKADIEREAWQVIKYMPNREGVKHIDIYQLVGSYDLAEDHRDSTAS